VEPISQAKRRTNYNRMLLGQNSQFEETQMIEKKKLAPRARFELATLRLTAALFT